MLRIDLNLLWTIINLLVLFVAMKFLLFKPVQKIIAARQEEADKRFGEAAAKQAEAEALKAQYTDSLANMEEEKKKTLQDARKEADVQYQKILKDAQHQAKQIKKDAIAEADAQKTQIMKNAEKEIADMVVNAATKVVGRQSGVEIDASLYNEFLDKAGEK
ncbi:MAG: ATP synthase F0 subunit B [Lachnospiraceae bacterium]